MDPKNRPKCLIIYADNCGATNKNNYILFFFHYLVHIHNYFCEVEICFMIAGHTKLQILWSNEELIK